MPAAEHTDENKVKGCVSQVSFELFPVLFY